MGITDQQFREILARAQEIQNAETGTDLPALIEAAEEVGISRRAVEQAVRERFGLPAGPPEVGALVFAHSADGRHYAAEVLEVGAEAVRVRFLRGSEHRVVPDQVRPASLVPGEKVMCEWPWWGPWKCTVLAYDAAKQRVKVSDGWGYTRTFPVGEVWLPPPRTEEGVRRERRRISMTLLGVGAALGAVLGSLLTLLIT